MKHSSDPIVAEACGSLKSVSGFLVTLSHFLGDSILSVKSRAYEGLLCKEGRCNQTATMSRYPSKRIHVEDYSSEALMQITLRHLSGRRDAGGCFTVAGSYL